MKKSPKYHIVCLRVTDSELEKIKAITTEKTQSISEVLHDIVFKETVDAATPITKD